jgi:colicin import membrane protein
MLYIFSRRIVDNPFEDIRSAAASSAAKRNAEAAAAAASASTAQVGGKRAVMSSALLSFGADDCDDSGNSEGERKARAAAKRPRTLPTVAVSRTEAAASAPPATPVEGSGADAKPKKAMSASAREYAELRAQAAAANQLKVGSGSTLKESAPDSAHEATKPKKAMSAAALEYAALRAQAAASAPSGASESEREASASEEVASQPAVALPRKYDSLQRGVQRVSRGKMQRPAAGGGDLAARLRAAREAATKAAGDGGLVFRGGGDGRENVDEGDGYESVDPKGRFGRIGRGGMGQSGAGKPARRY